MPLTSAQLNQLELNEEALVSALAAANAASSAQYTLIASLKADNVTPPPTANPITITSPVSFTGVAPYTANLVAQSTAGTISWNFPASPALPSGWSWAGNLSIVAPTAGTFVSTGTVNDSAGNSLTVTVSVTVTAPVVVNPPAAGTAQYGIFMDGANTPQSFQTLTGQPTTMGQWFGVGNTWNDLTNLGSGMVSTFKGLTGIRMLAPINICIGGATVNQTGFAEIVAGTHDAVFNKVFADLVAGGHADATIRLAWEFNLGWAPWSAHNGKQAPQAEFVPAIQHIVTLGKNVPGQKFVWMSYNPTLGDQGVGPLEAYYPGDAFCDIAALDVYDTSTTTVVQPAQWNKILTGPYGLTWLANFCQTHGKIPGLPEWGLWPAGGTSPYGGGDDPTFITNVLAWIKANGAVASYWNNGYTLSSPPNSLAAFKANKF